MGIERRINERVELSSDVEIQSPLGGKPQGVVRNVSEGGLAFETETAFFVGNRARLEVHSLPPRFDGLSHLQVRVTRFAQQGERFTVGVSRLLQVDPELGTDNVLFWALDR